MITEISNILNPVHLPTIKEFEDIAYILAKDTYGENWAGFETKSICLNLMKRWEELVMGVYVKNPKPITVGHNEIGKEGKDLEWVCEWQPVILQKEMFENSYANPYQNIDNIRGRGKNIVTSREWEKQQEKVWFKGGKIIKDGLLEIWSENMEASSHYNYKDKRLFNFIYECGRHKFKINCTENFVKQLINI